MVIKEEINNVIDILEKAKKALKENDSILLKELSNRTIHTASTAQDTDSIVLAVSIYSLSKLIEGPEYRESQGWNKLYNLYNKGFDDALKALKSGNDRRFIESIEKIQESVSKLSGDLRESVKDVLLKARINKASKIYEHGISMERTAKLLGISLWELTQYASQRESVQTNDKYTRSEDVKERVKVAMEMFK